MSEPEHGTNARYQQKCRCDSCRVANRDYQRAYRAQGRDAWVNAKLGTCVRGLGWPRTDNGYSVKLDQDSE